MAVMDDSEDTTKVAAESANDFDASAEKEREAVGPVVKLDTAHQRKLVEDRFKRHARDLVRWLKRRFDPGPPAPEALMSDRSLSLKRKKACTGIEFILFRGMHLGVYKAEYTGSVFK